LVIENLAPKYFLSISTFFILFKSGLSISLYKAFFLFLLSSSFFLSSSLLSAGLDAKKASSDFLNFLVFGLTNNESSIVSDLTPARSTLVEVG